MEPAASEASDKQEEKTTPVTKSPYDINLGLDLGVSVGALLVFGLPRLMAEETVRPWCGLDCDPDDLNALDRYVVGNHNHTADLISDLGAGMSYGLPFILSAIDVLASDPADGWIGFGKDTLIYVETLAITMSLNNLVNFAVRRPRPLVYDPNVDDKTRQLGDSSLGFPSGHTSGSFAMATAYSYTFGKRHPDSPWVVPVWLGTYALATTTGVLRTQAGEHFWTDVIAGAALGIATGLLIPYLHLAGDDSSLDPSEQSGSLQMRLSPAPLRGGLGAVLTIR